MQVVYILSNKSMDGIYKVGMTTRNVVERVRELSSATGLPTPFVVEAEYNVADAALAESMAHKALSSYRVNKNREFFQLNLQSLKQHLESALATQILFTKAQVIESIKNGEFDEYFSFQANEAQNAMEQLYIDEIFLLEKKQDELEESIKCRQADLDNIIGWFEQEKLELEKYEAYATKKTKKIKDSIEESHNIYSELQKKIDLQERMLVDSEARLSKMKDKRDENSKQINIKLMGVISSMLLVTVLFITL